jgi:diguanylate cyclase (GGDEF)-like protein
MGSIDMLTGVMNRNEMNNVVDELAHGIKEDVSVGVIFADLNGLMTVNDVNGHNAGDTLLGRMFALGQVQGIIATVDRELGIEYKHPGFFD